MSQYSNNKYINDNNHSWSLLYKLIDSNTKVLDIGCSSGNFGEGLIKQKSCVVDGIELNSKDSEMARNKLRNVYNLNVELDDISFFKEKYDYIVFADVIEHLINPVSTLLNIKKLLKKNGKIVYSLPNMAHISIRLQLLAGEFMYTETGLLDKTHLHFYTKMSIQSMFQEASYEIIKQDYTQIIYSKDFLENRFKELGLVMNDYKRYLQTDEANAFQFVGLAKQKVMSKSQEKAQSTIKQLPHNEDIVKQNEYIEGLKATIDNQNKFIEQQRHQIEEQKIVLSRIGHRWVTKIYKALRR